MFDNFEDIKRVAEKFEKGKIVPSRVLKAFDRNAKKYKHKLKFTHDIYRLKGLDGCNVFAVDCDERYKGYFIEFCVKGVSDATFQGNPYGTGYNFFEGNYRISNQEWLDSINKRVFGCNFLS